MAAGTPLASPYRPSEFSGTARQGPGATFFARSFHPTHPDRLLHLSSLRSPPICAPKSPPRAIPHRPPCYNTYPSSLSYSSFPHIPSRIAALFLPRLLCLLSRRAATCLFLSDLESSGCHVPHESHLIAPNARRQLRQSSRALGQARGMSTSYRP